VHDGCRQRDLASFIGRAQSLRLAVHDTAFRLRALYDSLHGQTDSDPGHGDYLGSSGVRASRHVPRHRVRLSHPALRDLAYWRDLRASLHHRPIWPKPETPTATVHTDASVEAYGATLRYGVHGAGIRSHYEVQGFWIGEHRELAHITIYELMTVRLTLQEFAEHCLLRQVEVIRLFTDNMMVMYTVHAMVSRSPLLMAEPRRLRAFLERCGISLQMHHLPSALNLYADRLSRRRKALHLRPRLTQIPDHWWTGESEHDLGRSWKDVDLLRPPLELLQLVPRKVASDSFRGLLLIPRWVRQNWYQALLALSTRHWVLLPDPSRPSRGWSAALLAFSREAALGGTSLMSWKGSCAVGLGGISPPTIAPKVLWHKEPD
jgi:hypothetical protein